MAGIERWRGLMRSAEAMLVLALATLLVTSIPFRRWATLLGRAEPRVGAERIDDPPSPATESSGADPAAVAVRAALDAAARRLPWRCRCLSRCLAARLMLGRRHIATRVTLGLLSAGVAVRDDSNDAIVSGRDPAHAWLCVDGFAVTGDAEAVGYTPITDFVASPRRPRRNAEAAVSELSRRALRRRSLSSIPLPMDGNGLLLAATADERLLRRTTRRLSPARPRLLPQPIRRVAATLLWVLLLPGRVAASVGTGRARPSDIVLWRLALDCLRHGLAPHEALWYRVRAHRIPPSVLGHRKAALLQANLGHRDDAALLRDKVALSDRLAAAGVPVAGPVRLVAATAEAATVQTLPEGRYFIKPRYGSGGAGAAAFTVLPGSRFRFDAGPQLTAAEAVAAILARLRTGPLMVQPFLDSNADLSPAPRTEGPGTILRLTMVRSPGGRARLNEILVGTPPLGTVGYDWRTWVWSPVDPETGRVETALRLVGATDDGAAPLPPNTPAIGTVWPGIDVLRDLAERATDLVPGLPMVGWDVVPTGGGPVFLEGNQVIGGTALADVRRALAGEPSILPALLADWIRFRATVPADGHAARRNDEVPGMV